MNDQRATDFSDDRLREALGEAARIAGDGEACPPPEQLRVSARGDLSPAENREVVEHLAGCTACGTAWRLARRLATEQAEAPGGDARGGELLRPAAWRRWAPFAAAAALILVAGLGIRYLTGPGEEAPVYRAEIEDWLQPLNDPGDPLPREACLLRWTPGPEGTSYHLRVTDEDLHILVVGRRLEAAEYLVPASTLEELPDRAPLLWQVSASLPDGRQVDSETFISSLE